MGARRVGLGLLLLAAGFLGARSARAQLIYTPSKTSPGNHVGLRFTGTSLVALPAFESPDFRNPATGDYDGDGRPDLIFTRFFGVGDGEHYVYTFDPASNAYLSRGTGATSALNFHSPFSADFDGLGIEDYVSVNNDASPPGPRGGGGTGVDIMRYSLDVFANQRFGTSTFGTPLSVWGAGDIDGDHADELLTISQDADTSNEDDEPTGTGTLFACDIGPGSVEFSRVCTALAQATIAPNAEGRYPTSVVGADLDGNQVDEVVVGFGTCCNGTDSATVRRYALSGGTFSQIGADLHLPGPFQYVTAADLDGDGRDELVASAGGQVNAGGTVTLPGAVQVYRLNTGTGLFELAASAAAPLLTRPPGWQAAKQLPKAEISAASVNTCRPPVLDSDGDGLPDEWEQFGADRNCDGVVDVDLPGMGAKPNHKDLFLEIFWVDDYEPSKAAITAVKQAFARAPVNAGGVPNPDGLEGINLWVDTGELLDSDGALVGDELGGPQNRRAHSVGPAPGPCNLKSKAFFDALAERDPDRVGISRFGLASSCGATAAQGYDAFVARIDDSPTSSVPQKNGATLMHELGHTLGLLHGGPQALANLNDDELQDAERACKPNHISVMSYVYQATGGIPYLNEEGTQISEMVDYSPSRAAGSSRIGLLPNLNEAELHEPAVIFPAGAPFGGAYVGQMMLLPAPSSPYTGWHKLFEPIDYNGMNGIESASVTANIDDFAGITGCTAEAAATATLENPDEWGALVMKPVPLVRRGVSPKSLSVTEIGGTPEFVDVEMTEEEVAPFVEAVNTADLELAFLPGPDSGVGVRAFEVLVENHGPNPSAETNVELELPPGTSLAGSEASCVEDPALSVGCELGAVMPGETLGFLVLVNVGPNPTASPRVLEGLVDNAKGPDPEPLNDTASVVLNSPPVALCGDFPVSADDTCHASAQAADVDAGSFDPDGDDFDCELVPSGSFGLGSHAVELTCTDSSGDFSSCDAFVIVSDTTPPAFTSVPADRTISSCTNVNLGTAEATDNCGSVQITNDKPSKFPLGATTVTYTAVDQAGNPIPAHQQVTAILADDTSCCPTGSTIRLGTSNNDTINGGSGADCILGLGGQDTLRGFGGSDAISGGAGDDALLGGDGNDRLYDAAGQNTLQGERGSDFLRGGSGDDTLRGGDDADTLYGGAAQDHLYGDAGNDALFGEAGFDILEGGSGNDALDGGSDTDRCIDAGVNTLVSCEQLN